MTQKQSNICPFCAHCQKKIVSTIVYLENAWTSNQMITEGEAAILLETTRRAFRNQSQSKQRSALTLKFCDVHNIRCVKYVQYFYSYLFLFSDSFYS